MEPQSQIDSVVIADLCSQAGYPEITAAFLKAALSKAEGKVRLASYDQIKNLCQTAGFPDKAADFIKDDCSVFDIQNSLLALLTSEDEPINNALTPKQQGLKPLLPLIRRQFTVGVTGHNPLPLTPNQKVSAYECKNGIGVYRRIPGV